MLGLIAHIQESPDLVLVFRYQPFPRGKQLLGIDFQEGGKGGTGGDGGVHYSPVDHRGQDRPSVQFHIRSGFCL